MPELIQGKPAQEGLSKDQPAGPSVTAGIEQLTYQQLRVRLNELQQQRQTIASRREALSQRYEGATGANRDGMGARLSVMDRTIVGMEQDIAVLARQVAIKAPVSEQGTSGPPDIYTEEDIAGVGFGVFLGTVLVTVLFMRRLARRRAKFGQPASAVAPQSNERLDRIEHAVDSIAIEIERVSENQRFMTRLMTETQLAGSLAAVRNSVDAAAKSGI